MAEEGEEARYSECFVAVTDDFEVDRMSVVFV